MKGSISKIPILLLIFGLLMGGGGGYFLVTNNYEPVIKEYKTQIADKTNEISQLSIQVSDLEVEKSNFKSHIITLEADLDEAEDSISSYESEISAQEKQVSTLESDLDVAEETIFSYASKISALETQVRSLQAYQNIYTNIVSTLQADTDVLETRLEDISNIVVTQHYSWEYSSGWYSSSEWTWDLPISLGTYFNYHYKERPESWSDWIDMVNDPDDDFYISSMVQHINSAAYSEGFTESQKVDFVIAFVQSLPYTVDSVTTDWNEYPRYPLETLFDRGGDCEDTSILVAALLDRMGYDVCLLLLSHANHCAVGISLEGVSGSYYDHDGKQYYYLETTGEGWEIGDLPSSIIDSRAFIYPVNP